MPTTGSRMITAIANKMIRIATSRIDMITRATRDTTMNIASIRDGGFRHFLLPVLTGRRVWGIRVTMIV